MSEILQKRLFGLLFITRLIKMILLLDVIVVVKACLDTIENRFYPQKSQWIIEKSEAIKSSFTTTMNKKMIMDHRTTYPNTH